MNGAFGGLLELVGQLGLGLQHLARWILYALIGKDAKKWILSDLNSMHKDFKDQRITREIIGIAAIFSIVLFLHFGVALLIVLFFVVAIAVREHLEKNKPD